MLGKLFKYEFKNTAKIFLPLFAIVIFISIMSKVTMLFQDNLFVNIFSGFLILAYVLSIFVCNVAVFGIQVFSFYKTTFGDQGYLSHTLPVKGGHLLFSKWIVSGIWSLTAAIVSMISITILLIGLFEFRDIIDGMKIFLSGISVWFGLGPESFGFFSVLLLILAFFMLYIPFYGSIIIGHRFGRHKVLGAVAAYVAIYTAQQVIYTVYYLILSSIFSNTSFSLINTNPYDAVDPDTVQPLVSLTFFPLIILYMVSMTALYIVAHNIINKKVDLD